MNEETFAYTDILHEHRPRSAAHPPMGTEKRAAQFAPFAALKGHEEAVAETARLTEREICPDEAVAEEIDRVLRGIEQEARPTAVMLTRFEPDARKAGGRYLRSREVVLRIDRFHGELVLEGGERVPTASLTAVERCG